MTFFQQLFSNDALMCAVIAWFAAQIGKTVVTIIRTKRLSFVSLVASGGMPSSHSSSVCALATAVGLDAGFDSPLFALAVLFAFIVMYDASGVRRAAGMQAQVLNRIMDDLDHGKTDEMPERLKELIGHTPFQVFIGGAIGILIALGYCML